MSKKVGVVIGGGAVKSDVVGRSSLYGGGTLLLTREF